METQQRRCARFHRELSASECPSQGLCPDPSPWAKTHVHKAHCLQSTVVALWGFPAGLGDNQPGHSVLQPSHQAARHSVCVPSAQLQIQSLQQALEGSYQGESMRHAVEQIHSKSHYTKLNQCFPGNSPSGHWKEESPEPVTTGSCGERLER